MGGQLSSVSRTCNSLVMSALKLVHYTCFCISCNFSFSFLPAYSAHIICRILVSSLLCGLVQEDQQFQLGWRWSGRMDDNHVPTRLVSIGNRKSTKWMKGPKIWPITGSSPSYSWNSLKSDFKEIADKPETYPGQGTYWRLRDKTLP